MLKNLFRKKKENLILIALDGVRLDRFRDFPYFRQIKEKGTLFSEIITYAPHSIASFYAIFTGVYGNKSGVNSYFGTLNFHQKECKTFPQYLQENSYYCLGDSMNELVVPAPGFDKLVIQEEFNEFIDSHKQLFSEVAEKNREGKACFLHLHCSYLHNSVVKGIIKPFKDKEEEYYFKRSENEKKYLTYLEEINQYLKIIMGELDKYNFWDNSLIVFFSDHGNSLGEKKGEVAYGNFCFDYSLKTFALFIKKGFFPNKEIIQMLRTVDIIPTLLDYLKIVPDKTKIALDGESFLNLLLNKKVEPRTAFSETGGISGPHPSPKEPNVHSLRTDHWKLIFYRQPERYELYNLKEDPEEKNNLYGQGLIQVEHKLKALLQEQIS